MQLSKKALSEIMQPDNSRGKKMSSLNKEEISDVKDKLRATTTNVKDRTSFNFLTTPLPKPPRKPSKQWLSGPSKDGEVEYSLRDSKLAIPVVDGRNLCMWFEIMHTKRWRDALEKGESTQSFMLNYVVPTIVDSANPRLHDILVKEAKNSESEKEKRAAFFSYQKSSNGSSVEVYQLRDVDYAFISHVWADQLKHMFHIVSLKSYLKIWVDICCVAQHPGAESKIQRGDLKGLSEAIYSASEFTVLTDAHGHYFTRVWCLFEFANRVKSGKAMINILVNTLPSNVYVI